MASRIRSILSRQWELVVALGERRRGATIQQLEVQVLDEPADAHPEYDEQALFAHSAKIWSGDPEAVATELHAALAAYPSHGS